MSKDNAKPDMPEALASGELDRLVAEHDADLAAAGADTFQPGEAVPPDAGDMGNAKCVAMGLEMAVAMGKAYFPSLERTAPPEKCQQVAESVGAVLDKYGVAAGGWLTQYGAELTALVTCSTFGMGVYAGIKADIAAREAEQRRQPAPAAPPVPVTGETPPEADADLPGWKEVNGAARG